MARKKRKKSAQKKLKSKKPRTTTTPTKVSRRGFFKKAGLLVAVGVGAYVGISHDRSHALSDDSLERVLNGYGYVEDEVFPERPNRLYVIGQIHSSRVHKGRLPDHLYSGIVESYRIGQGFAKEGVKVFFGEGRTADFDYTSENAVASAPYRDKAVVSRLTYDDDFLKKYIGAFINQGPSDLGGQDFLVLDGSVNLQGAEDPIASNLVIDRIGKMRQLLDKGGLYKPSNYIAELASREVVEGFDAELADTWNTIWHYIDIRSAKVLQNAPQIIEREINAGRASRKAAVIYMGAAHLDEMIRYSEQDLAFIPGRKRYAQPSLPPREISLGLKDAGYGVTFIMTDSIPEEQKHKNF